MYMAGLAEPLTTQGGTILRGKIAGISNPPVILARDAEGVLLRPQACMTFHAPAEHDDFIPPSSIGQKTH